MARIKKSDIESRENFVLEQFQRDHELSIPKANDALKAKFGSKMRAQRMYELRKLALSPTTAAGRAAVGNRTAGPLVTTEKVGHPDVAIVRTGNENEGNLLRSIFSELRKQGLSNLNVEHVAPGYVVVAVQS